MLEEEIQSLEESEVSLSAYCDWYSSTHKNFKNVATKIDKVDKAMMGKKMKTLEVGVRMLHLSPSLSQPLSLHFAGPSPYASAGSVCVHPLPWEERESVAHASLQISSYDLGKAKSWLLLSCDVISPE